MIQAIINKIKTNTYKFFFLKLFFFLLLVFILDFSIGNLLNYFYFKQESGMQYRTTYSIEKTNADVLIFGSSRANHHYYPDIFENRLNLTFYNVGRDGNFIFYHYAILKCILKRYSPKIVILDFVNKEFSQNSESYDRISSLLPYYRTHPEIRSIIELKSKYEKYKLFSKIYPFNSSIFTIAIGNTELNKKRRGDIKGYVPLSEIWNEPIKNDTSSIKYQLDNKKIECYENFIKDCKKQGIKLYVFASPCFVKASHSDYSVTIGKEIAKKYDTKFYDYSNDTLFTSNRLLFADLVHLNNNGAKIFSNIVLDRIINDK